MDLQQGDEFVTWAGYPVRILCVDRDCTISMPIVGLVRVPGYGEVLIPYFKDGTTYHFQSYFNLSQVH